MLAGPHVMGTAPRHPPFPEQAWGGGREHCKRGQGCRSGLAASAPPPRAGVPTPLPLAFKAGPCPAPPAFVWLHQASFSRGRMAPLLPTAFQSFRRGRGGGAQERNSYLQSGRREVLAPLVGEGGVGWEWGGSSPRLDPQTAAYEKVS